MNILCLQRVSRRAAARSIATGLAALLLAGGCARAGAADFTGRGLFSFKSDSGCPFSALAPTGECNRIALDDNDTRATLDSASHAIHFTNTRRYGDKTVVADVLLQGTGQVRGGQRVPLTFHALLSRHGDQWAISSHAHAPVAGTFTDIRIDPYRVIAHDAKGERVLLAPVTINKTVSSPSLAARLAKAFVRMDDNRADAGASPDVTVALGLGRLAVPVVRAKFEVPPDAAGAKPTVSDALRAGNWSFELQALSGRIPHDVMRRELFLYGLDTLPAVQPLMQKPWPAHATLRVGAVNGQGYVGYGDQQQEFAGADDAARAFLQGSFVGLALGWQQHPQAAQPRAHGH
jgi:hypothetical protein